MDIERQNFMNECEQEGHLELVKAIIERKKKGVDCTEQESAEIKQLIKRTAFYPKEIQELFPIEYSEAISEIFNQN